MTTYILTGRHHAQLLVHPESNIRRSDITHLVSIRDADARAPDRLLGFCGCSLYLDFEDDEVPGKGAPAGYHAQALLTFGRALQHDDGDKVVLIHCEMGISRSPAALMVLLAAQGLPADRCLQRMLDAADWSCHMGYRVDPYVKPNRRLLLLADALLGHTGTELVSQAEQTFSYAAPLAAR